MRRLGLTGLVAGVVVLVLGVFAPAGPAKSYRCMVINDRLDTTYHWSLQDGQPVQSAIDAASPGDTLWLRGECPGPVEITKSLTLTGQAIPGFHYAPTIRAGGGIGDRRSVVHVSGSDVQVQINSLTLTGGGNYRFPVEYGGGIFNDQGRVTLNDVTITENWAEKGGGIFNDQGTVELINSTIDTNFIWLPAQGLGGGIYTNGGTVILNASKITNNQYAFQGGGIYAYGGRVIATASEIAYNQHEVNALLRVDDGGGIAMYANPDDAWNVLYLTDTKIHDNAAKVRGGGIYALRAYVTITGTSELTANHAGYGGGAYVYGTLRVSGEAKIYGNTAESNAGDSYGGGVRFSGYPYNAAGTFTMSGNAKIYGNSAGTSGGGISSSYAISLSGCIAGAEEDGANVFDNTPDDIYPPLT